MSLSNSGGNVLLDERTVRETLDRAPLTTSLESFIALRFKEPRAAMQRGFAQAGMFPACCQGCGDGIPAHLIT